MDELNRYLMQKYPEFMTGRTDCNLLVWGNGETPKLCTLIVGADYDPFCNTKECITGLLNQKYKDDSHFRRMYRFGSEIASRGSVPYVVLAFPSFRKSYGNRWEETVVKYPPAAVSFYLHRSPSEQCRLISGKELREEIYHILGVTYTDTGTTKEKNKSIADYFQFWSRSFLSRHIVKLDIDGMFSGPSGGVLIEIKRSNRPPIPIWKPYEDDYPDYVLLKKFADSLSMDFTILHHDGLTECSGKTVISLLRSPPVQMTD